MEQLPIDSYKLLRKQKNSISINKSLIFSLIGIKQEIVASITLYIFRLFT